MNDTFTSLMAGIQSRKASLSDAEINHRNRRERRTGYVKKARQKLSRVVPPLFDKAHIRHLPRTMKPVIDAVQHWEDNTPKGMLLFGPVGTGKTYALMAIARHFIVTKKISVRAITYRELSLKIRRSFSHHDISEDDVLKPYIEAPILIVDDIGTARSGSPESDYSRDMFLHVIDTRINHRRPTLLSSNLTPDEIEHAFGLRTGSRISEFLLLHVRGRDRRKAGAA